MIMILMKAAITYYQPVDYLLKQSISTETREIGS